MRLRRPPASASLAELGAGAARFLAVSAWILGILGIEGEASNAVIRERTGRVLWRGHPPTEYSGLFATIDLNKDYTTTYRVQ